MSTNRPPADLAVRFLGVRGTVPPYVPSAEFGNHTTAVEVSADRKPPVLVDLGTGVIAAGARLEEGLRHFTVCMTHLHLDHLNGALAFAPLYRGDCRVRILAARADVQDALERLFSPPLHPVRFEDLKADIVFEDITGRGVIDLPDHALAVTAAQVPHPQGAVAYRFQAGASAFVFATDIELANGGDTGPFESLLATPFPAGMAAIDGFFQPHEINRFADWGHSTWEQDAELCRRSGVERLLVTHHHFAARDETLNNLEREAGYDWAREGDLWTLTDNRARKSRHHSEP